MENCPCCKFEVDDSTMCSACGHERKVRNLETIGVYRQRIAAVNREIRKLEKLQRMREKLESRQKVLASLWYKEHTRKE